MKKTTFLYICCALLSILNANAQREVIEYRTDFNHKVIHWGYYMGLNSKDFKISYTEPNTFVEVEATTGFNVGLIGGWRIHNNITLRIEPGLSSNTKTLTFTNIEGEDYERIRQIGGTYLHFPLLIKFNTNRIGNLRPYVIAGASYDYNFSSNEENPDDNFSGEFRMKTNTFGYEVGIGMDIYFPYFIFSPSIRGTFAITNELVYDNSTGSPWTNPIDFLGTRGVFLNFAFH